ncbi:MAG TPA: response regulator [Pyrinomonadaceae bacterium]|jgi:DNA-binding response OmpR family regulator|nr:response regulator [Pyrinomonadaceae bacterium]
MTAERTAILYVEDTQDTRFLVEWSLQQEGFDVTAVPTAEEGLTHARENSYALILLDIGLTDMDGLALCREIREFNRRTPILFFTAYASLLDHEEAKRAGAQGCLRKPEDTPRLIPAIRTLIGQAEG